MCTIGTHRIGADDFLVFKNKDFPRPSFEDRIVIDEGVFGVAGVATWFEPEPATDWFSGMSVGVNTAGLLCADANVQGATGFSSYDDTVYVSENPHVRRGLTVEGVRWAFGFDRKAMTYWHPLTWLSWAIDYQVYGGFDSSGPCFLLLQHIYCIAKTQLYVTEDAINKSCA